MKLRSMTVSEFNKVMNMCKQNLRIRYVTPTIHPGTGVIYEIVIHTAEESRQFSINNTEDHAYSLYEDVADYIRGLVDYEELR